MTRKKVTYSDYEDGAVEPEGAFDFGKHMADFEEVAAAKIADAEAQAAAEFDEKAKIESEFSAVKAELEEIKPKYDEFVAADEKRKADELDAQKNAKFAEYEDALAENADFAAIKEKKDELSVDEIEKECAVLYVKVNRKNNFSKQDSSTAVAGVLDDGDDNDSNCWMSEKYGAIHINR